MWIKRRIIAEKNGAFTETTSSMRMEIEAATAAIEWLVSSNYSHCVILTDSMSMLSKGICCRPSGDKC